MGQVPKGAWMWNNLLDGQWHVHNLANVMLSTAPKPREDTQCWAQSGLAEGTKADKPEDAQNTPPVKKVNWFNRIWFIKGLCTYAQCPMKISCSVVPKAQHAAALNGCHQDAGHQECDHNLSLLWDISGGQEWPTKCRNPWSPAHIACSMRANCPRCPYTWLCPPLQWISYM